MMFKLLAYITTFADSTFWGILFIYFLSIFYKNMVVVHHRYHYRTCNLLFKAEVITMQKNFQFIIFDSSSQLHTQYNRCLR